MLPLTSLLASVLAVMLIGLSLAVSMRRAKVGTDIGLGEDEDLFRRIRAQGNFIEYVPMALILCALAEYRGAATPWIWTLAGLLLLGRIAHAAGMLSRSNVLRAVGMIATYLSLLIGAAAQLFA